jgi:hypothetical protein
MQLAVERLDLSQRLFRSTGQTGAFQIFASTTHPLQTFLYIKNTNAPPVGGDGGRLLFLLLKCPAAKI